MSMRHGMRVPAVLATAFCSLARADFQLARSHDRRHPQGHSQRRNDLQADRRGLHRASETYNVASRPNWSPPTVPKVPKPLGAIRTGSPVKFPTDIRGDQQDRPRLRPSTPARRRTSAAWKTTMSDPSVSQQYGMVVGIPHARARSTRSRCCNHSRRTFGDLQRQVRRGTRHGAAGGRARAVRRVSQAAGRARIPQRRSTRSTAATPT